MVKRRVEDVRLRITVLFRNRPQQRELPHPCPSGTVSVRAANFSLSSKVPSGGRAEMAKAKNSASKSKKADRAIHKKKQAAGEQSTTGPGRLASFSLSPRRGRPSLFSSLSCTAGRGVIHSSYENFNRSIAGAARSRDRDGIARTQVFEIRHRSRTLAARCSTERSSVHAN